MPRRLDRGHCSGRVRTAYEINGFIGTLARDAAGVVAAPHTLQIRITPRAYATVYGVGFPPLYAVMTSGRAAARSAVTIDVAAVIATPAPKRERSKRVVMMSLPRASRALTNDTRGSRNPGSGIGIRNQLQMRLVREV